MLKNVFRMKGHGASDGEKELLSLELLEVKEIADAIFRRIETKLAELRKAEASVDASVSRLSDLLSSAERVMEELEKRMKNTGIPDIPATGSSRIREAVALRERGISMDEIAVILDIPIGELELMLSIHHPKY